MDTILSKASWRFFLAQPLQLGLAILGIALGVAVVTSVDIARVSADLYITTPGPDATAFELDRAFRDRTQ